VAEAFGSCIKIAYYNGIPIGFIQYAPPKFFPRTKEYASGPPNDDAVFLACLYITNKEYHGKGFGTKMLKDLVTQLKNEGFKAVETFARKESVENPSGPLKFYLKQNFRIKIDKDDFPLIRLEL
jgi:GNAT superfamily N-acetyltransferase